MTGFVIFLCYLAKMEEATKKSHHWPVQHNTGSYSNLKIAHKELILEIVR